MSNFTKIGTRHTFNTLNSELGSKFRNLSNLLFYCQFLCSIVKNPLFSKTLLKLCQISQFGTRHNLNRVSSKIYSKFWNLSNLLFYTLLSLIFAGIKFRGKKTAKITSAKILGSPKSAKINSRENFEFTLIKLCLVPIFVKFDKGLVKFLKSMNF